MLQRLCSPRLAVAAAMLLVAAPARADLADYVKQAEPKFAWKVTGQNSFLGAKVYDLEMTSQVWQNITWQHNLQIVLPEKVKPTATAFLWNQGGSGSLGTKAMAVDLAKRMKAPVVFLYGIPNQPLFGDPTSDDQRKKRGMTEDTLIAETFVRYLETKDGSWPLLFPMVKSLVKAMDAVQEFAKKEWKTEIKSFVVSGASKRGWTTWLTAASDPRVKAIMPLVIDTLNMPKQMDHQLASYGKYSEMIRDYTNRKLVPMPKTGDAKKLWTMVDPWAYRDKYKMPKLILNGTNDPYWTQDALNLYWDDLPGDKWVTYIPNAGHNLAQMKDGKPSDLTKARNVMAAFGYLMIHDKPMPKQTWKHGEANGKYTLSVTTDQAPKAARVWVADAKTKDFRRAEWRSDELKVDKTGARVEVAPPATGCRVFLMECEYEKDGLRYTLSTQVRIIGKPVEAGKAAE